MIVKLDLTIASYAEMLKQYHKLLSKAQRDASILRDPYFKELRVKVFSEWSKTNV